jgi:formylglycine-generating enzyme required for sulfatase activity
MNKIEIDPSQLRQLSDRTEAILCPPFEWCFIPGGSVSLVDASDYGGTKGGTYQVPHFAIGKYLVTNGQYRSFIEHTDGFDNAKWWDYSPQAIQWRKDHAHPKPPAFLGRDLPCTRVSWFDSVAFCNWLSTELNATIRLPTEQEWQRAAVGDTGWRYPWGDELDETRANYGESIGQVSPVGNFPMGQSSYGVMDMIGNLWEWCLTIWGTEAADLKGYVYRVFRGGAWNVSNPEYLRAIDRGEGHSPRGMLNDCGFRILLEFR